MAKKRDRRVGLGSGRQSDRVKSSAREDQIMDSTHSRNRDFNRPVFFTIFFVLSAAISVILYRGGTSGDRTLPQANEHQIGFANTDLNYQDVLTENMKVSENLSDRHFPNPVLAYITPWNSKGYELAKRFNLKFTHISPVWYDLKSQGTELTLEGRHNADTHWISELRVEGEALVLPRIVLEAIPVGLLRKKKQRDKAINLIIAECKEMGYDGIVLESWSRWAAHGVLHDPDMRNMALQFIKQLGHTMHSVSLERQSKQKTLQLVYVIGPPQLERLQEHDFGPEDLRSLSDAVDGYSLMTYDFSSPYNPGPNAPLKWIRATLQLLLGDDKKLAQKVFVGINFYGNDFVLSGALGGGPIIGREYLSLLEQYKPQLQWEKNSAEHLFLYSDDQDVKHVVFYPSLTSISLRLKEAQSWGAGISIWEIGQGLDYFLDIL